ncbi:MAG: hypothetical protein KF760_08985 [Candidatus Eremiobacteraeota bacterium]|nr:hypothetical protein [Candidatus Eremiobacteraeota bacterium]MCW5869286.1 hypothetical protein [Candidatus Eremiobacteraeota bacterium]
MRHRASTLLASLALVALVLVLGLAFLTRRSADYQIASLQLHRAQARALSLAGLEDARAKLDHDLNFPPPLELTQKTFHYAELVYDLDEVGILGSYEVTVDQTYNTDPYRIITVESNGMSGFPSRASYRVQAEIDASPRVRGGTADNPDYWKVIRLVEQLQPQ